MTTERDRIRRIIEKWFLCEPVLFGAWTTHALVMEPRIRTIRVRAGQVEYNPAFIAGLKGRQLESVLQFEALRILLKHPYNRHQSNAELTYIASNITLQEHLQTDLPFPRAQALFGTDEYDQQYLEFYYAKLLDQAERLSAGTGSPDEAQRNPGIPGFRCASSGLQSDGDDSDSPPAGTGGGERGGGDGEEGGPAGVEAYADADQTGKENVEDWAPDDFLTDRINDAIRSAEENRNWGSVAGRLRERILATLRPPLDYRAVLRQFRTSILSAQRSLTRMKPNRRYGFQYLGSRRDFATRLLVAVDVSGSMGSGELAHGFSLINQFFKYGVPYIDVIQFDTEIQGTPLTLRKARHGIEVTGRGGTDFAPVMTYLDAHNNYDGLIIFTDGYASVPQPPKNRRTRIMWLFNHETQYQQCYPPLKHLGKAAFIKSDAKMG